MPVQGTHLPIPVGFDWLQTAVRGFFRNYVRAGIPCPDFLHIFFDGENYGGKNQDGR